MFQAITNKLTTIACATGLLTTLALPLAAQEFRVEGAGLEAVPTSYRGPCPGLIKFQGKIQASAAGRVKYTYFRSDGATGPEGFVDFEGPGVKLVETTWTLGGASLTHFTGWVAIRITSPNSYESNRASFVLDCKPGKEKQPNQRSGGRSEQNSEHQLISTLQAMGNFNTLLIALDKTGLTDTLKGAGPFTIFAPNDEAFAKLPSGVLDALMKDPAELKRLLLYHITAGKLSFKDLQSRTDKSITMMDNTKAEVQCSSSPANSQSKAKIIGPESKATMHDNDLSPALMVINKSARVIITDRRASNGMIHVIDTVLAPGTHWLTGVSDVPGEVAVGRISSLAAPVGGLSPTSKGSFIACPVKETRTEVTTPLPEPWWNTPQIGNLERVSVQTIGGNRTLVCEYWAYARTVSIMRAFPEGTTDCSAEGNGFRCR